MKKLLLTVGLLMIAGVCLAQPDEKEYVHGVMPKIAPADTITDSVEESEPTTTAVDKIQKSGERIPERTELLRKWRTWHMLPS